jgi:hypothetical protein
MNNIPLLAVIFVAELPAFDAEATSARMPELNWEQRSDWINIKTAANPPALGDGEADNTAAKRTRV